MLNVPFRYHDLPDENPLVAMRAFLWLKRVHPDLAVDFAKRTFSRLWVDGKSISSTLDIAEVAGPLGIDAVELARQVAEPRAKEDLKRAVDEAVFQGVFGVPFFRVDGEPLWGVDRLWMLEHWLAHGSWASPRQEST